MKMNTKFIAALAVFAMAFAGFGAMAVTEANDADEPAVDVLVINIAGAIDDEKLIALINADDKWALKYTVELDDNIEEEITILNKEYYDEMKKAFMKGGIISFTPADLIDPEMADAVEGLKLFTSLEMNKLGDIVGGVDTAIVYSLAALPEGWTKAITLDFVFEEDAEAAIIATVALIEAFYADYSSPEEVQAAIDDAVAKYKDYLSPEMVEKAKQAAVEQYIIDHPVVEKENKVFFYAFIVVLAALIAVVGVFAYKDFIKPRMNAKKAAVKAAEPPQQ